MTPNFTNINLIVNTFNEFWEKEFAFDFSESLSISPDDVFLYSPEEHIKQKVKHFESLFELAEGEITHNIFAGNTLIINSLFQQIKSHRNHVYPKREGLMSSIQAWNEESNKETAKYFDLNHFDKYCTFLVEQGHKLALLFDKYIARFDAGEFTHNKEEKTLQERTIKWAQNNKFIVGFVILGVVLAFIVAQSENAQKIIGWVHPKGKELGGIVTDKAKNGLSGVSVIFGEHGFKRDSTDSFGKFQFADLQGEGIKTEVVHLKRSGYRDTSFAIKINYDSDEKLERIEIVLNVKSDLDFCIEGDVQACYRYADAIAASCPVNEGQARTACIFKAEMWRAVGDDYQDMLNAKKDSGEASLIYKETFNRWKHQIEMANAMPNW